MGSQKNYTEKEDMKRERGIVERERAHQCKENPLLWKFWKRFYVNCFCHVKKDGKYERRGEMYEKWRIYKFVISEEKNITKTFFLFLSSFSLSLSFIFSSLSFGNWMFSGAEQTGKIDLNNRSALSLPSYFSFLISSYTLSVSLSLLLSLSL